MSGRAVPLCGTPLFLGAWPAAADPRAPSAITRRFHHNFDVDRNQVPYIRATPCLERGWIHKIEKRTNDPILPVTVTAKADYGESLGARPAAAGPYPRRGRACQSAVADFPTRKTVADRVRQGAKPPFCHPERSEGSLGVHATILPCLARRGLAARK